MEEYFKKIGIMHDDKTEEVDPPQLIQMWKYGRDCPGIDVLSFKGKTRTKLERRAVKQSKTHKTKH